MNSPQFGLRVASVLAGLVAVAHVLRLLARLTVVIGGIPLAPWVSAGGVVVAGLLCFWFWRLSRFAPPAAGKN